MWPCSFPTEEKRGHQGFSSHEDLLICSFSALGGLQKVPWEKGAWGDCETLFRTFKFLQVAVGLGLGTQTAWQEG